MCEWLSYGEWCDVKLMCGGRVFNAHRAVLASVSSFLREILLSCTTDDMPTFIVLPEFDFEAMSSVLYYVYNGEVTLPKHKINMFLDIIKAMKIFIDFKNLCQVLNDYNDVPADFNINSEIFIRAGNNVFALEGGDYKSRTLINLKRTNESQDTLLHYSQNKSDFSDTRYQNRSERLKSCLGNLNSSYGDRQRNSFLRDLYIETYPRNGNANGLNTSVPAISNEYYRAPASLLLTNANDQHLKTDDTLSNVYKNPMKRLSFRLHDTLDSSKHLSCERNANENESYKNILGFTCLKSCPESSNDSNPNGDRCFNHKNMQPDASLLKLKEQFSKTDNSSLGLKAQRTTTISHVRETSKVSVTDNSILLKLKNETIRNPVDNDFNNCAKVLNHVLESPWCPRVPKNYKPFRRKLKYTDTMPQFDKIVKETENISDDNNNIHDISITSTTSKISNASNRNDSEIAANISEELKCSICNQIFATDESLSDHKKSHSSSARYACSECGKTFSQLRNFKYHMSIHRGTREFAATCSVCGKYFNDRGYLSSHMKIHRNRKEYKCTLCPKSFNQRVAYNMHVRIHTGVKPHVCEECGKAFSRKMLLKQHQRIHSGERPYACPHCDKRFADRSNMTLHLRLHTGIKPFSCSLCPKSFTKKHHLKSHLNFHTGSKPYSCPRCKLAFTQSSNMRTHMKKCIAPDPSSNTQTPSLRTVN